MEKIARPDTGKPAGRYAARVRKRSWLSPGTFELELSRPAGFDFTPGQRIRFAARPAARDYSLVSAPLDPFLGLCVRKVEGGVFSSRLADADADIPFEFSGPYGYFVHRPSSRPVVLVATGTGVAPFVSMARSGLRHFVLLHGVRSPEARYYAALFQKASRAYVPCLSGGDPDPEGFSGRVTDYLSRRLTAGTYDFYLCGRSDMIRDAVRIIDDRFPESFVYTEIYF